MSSVWNLIKNGRFREASVLAEELYAQTRDILCLRNEVLALLNLNEFEDAIELSKRIIQLRSGDTDSDHIFLGDALWLSFRHAEALRAWQDGTQSEYRDAAGGLEITLLQYYAAVRLGDAQLLSKCEVSLRDIHRRASQIWPSPLSGYLLNRTSAGELSSVMSASPILKAKQICQASFYFGVVAWRQFGRPAAKPFFADATSQGVVTLTKQEYYLARHEVSEAG
jgi:tetratricopeptide (TPR) repeat protein